MEQLRRPIILSVGGGKGGVGKSMVCANLAVHYAQAGLRTVVLDLDFGAANLHTIFGMRQPAKSLSNYFATARSHVRNYLVDSGVENLSLAPASGCTPDLAMLRHALKAKLVRQIRQLDADIVLLDLGAGSSHNVVDFFAMTQCGVLVTTPEPTSVVNTYEFLKNVVYRILFRFFRRQPELLRIVKQSTMPSAPDDLCTISHVIDSIGAEHPWLGDCVRDACRDLSLHMVFNQARKASDAQLGHKLHNICENHLSLDLNYAGLVYYNEQVPSSVLRMQPISVSKPDSPTSLGIKRISQNILSKVLGLDASSFDHQARGVKAAAKAQFADNRLATLHEQRQS